MEATMVKSDAQPPKNGTWIRSISPPPQMSPLRVMLLGKTDSGKSASANTILGREAFEEDLSPLSVTKMCSNQHTVVDGRQITVIDTPGLCDTERPMKELKGEMEKCVEMCLPGPHAILLVIKLARYTEEERNAVKLIHENFGDGVLNHTIVLLTHGDVLEGKPVEDYLRKSPALSSDIEHFGGRYHVFNNKSKDSTQVRELKEKIEAMVEKNGGACYTIVMYKEAQRKIREEEERRKAEEERRKAEEERRKKQNELELEKERRNRREAEMNAAEQKCKRFIAERKNANISKKHYETEEQAMKKLRQECEKRNREFEAKTKTSKFLFWTGMVLGAPLAAAAIFLTGGLAAAALAAGAAAAVGLGTVNIIFNVKNAEEAAAAAIAAGKAAEAAANNAANAKKEEDQAEKDEAAAAAARVKLAEAAAAEEKQQQ